MLIAGIITSVAMFLRLIVLKDGCNKNTTFLKNQNSETVWNVLMTNVIVEAFGDASHETNIGFK